MNLDYTLETPEERTELVQQICESTPADQLTQSYLNILSDYIFDACSKQERKQRKILNNNRLVTINRHETSLEGICGKLENGENSIYSMLNTLGKAVILIPKIKITPQDIETVPGLKDLQAAIKLTESQFKNARGKRKYLLKKQLIEMHQDQYILKNDYYKPIRAVNAIKSFTSIDLSETITISATQEPQSNGLITFFNPAHISAILTNYSALKEDAYGNFKSDAYFMLEDFDALVDSALKQKYPLYYDLIIYKIDGKSNLEIQQLIKRKYEIEHSIEYISSLWRNKIPKIIAETAKRNYIQWYYTYIKRGKWKRCSCCGEIKLAHNYFFSKNSTSKDGYYSICKECRNKKRKKGDADNG